MRIHHWLAVGAIMALSAPWAMAQTQAQPQGGVYTCVDAKAVSYTHLTLPTSDLV